jgi:hypothetical protein
MARVARLGEFSPIWLFAIYKIGLKCLGYFFPMETRVGLHFGRLFLVTLLFMAHDQNG